MTRRPPPAPCGSVAQRHRTTHGVVLAALLAAVLLAPVPGLRAQDKPVPPSRPPQRAEETGISLPEYVITGSDIIRFSEQRKDTLPFQDNRTFLALAGRGARGLRTATLERLRAPLEVPFLAGQGNDLRFLLAYGRFQSPLADIRYGHRWTEGDLAASLRFTSADGHVPRADFSALDLACSGGSWLGATLPPLLARSRVEGFFSLGSDRYGLYGLRGLAGSTATSIRRELHDIRYGGALRSRNNAVIDHTLEASVSHFLAGETTSTADSARSGEEQREEHLFTLRAAVRHDVEGYPLHAELLVSTGSLTRMPASDHSPFYLRAAAQSRAWLSADLLLSGELRFLLYRGSADLFHTTVLPAAQLTWVFEPRLQFFAELGGDVAQTTLASILRANPYADIASQVKHQDTPLQLRLGTAIAEGIVQRLRIFVAYDRPGSYLVFRRHPGLLTGIWDATYPSGITIVGLHADAQLAVGKRCSVLATFILQNARDADGREVPYTPVIDLTVAARYSFPFGLELAADARCATLRRGDIASLPGFVRLDLSGTYSITRHVGVALMLNNLLDASYEHWEMYPERPMTFFLGLTGRW